MRTFANIESFTAFLGTLETERAKREGLELACKLIKAKAKEVIGTYEFGWPQLAESTQADRERKGYAANEPLLRDGTLRDSIEYTIIEPGKRAEVGSNLDIAVYQELGTATIPARSFLAGAAVAEAPACAEVIGEMVAAAIGGKDLATELVRIIGHVAHDLKERAEEVLENDDEGKNEHH